MQKLTLQFLNTQSPIPIVCIPLADGKSIYAIIDTGADSSVYDKSVKITHPDLLLKRKHMGICPVTGVNATKKMSIYISGIKLNVKKEDEEGVALKFCAVEHKNFTGLVTDSLKEREGILEKIPLLIGSDMLIRYNAKIDMKKKTISFIVRKDVKKKRTAA